MPRGTVPLLIPPEPRGTVTHVLSRGFPRCKNKVLILYSAPPSLPGG